MTIVENRPIRVLLADDHAVVRAGLVELLRTAEGLEVVGQAADGYEAVSMAHDLEPDVVLMDLFMPGLDGTEATRQITSRGSRTRVVALTSSFDRERVLDTFDAGAVGYVLKDAEPDEVIKAVRCAAAGLAPVDPRAAQVLLLSRNQAGRDSTFGLTARETQVLALLTAGCPNKRIARRLGISEATVKAHLTSVFQTLGVSDRTQAALWAHRHGLSAAPDEVA